VDNTPTACTTVAPRSRFPAKYESSDRFPRSPVNWPCIHTTHAHTFKPLTPLTHSNQSRIHQTLHTIHGIAVRATLFPAMRFCVLRIICGSCSSRNATVAESANRAVNASHCLYCPEGDSASSPTYQSTTIKKPQRHIHKRTIHNLEEEETRDASSHLSGILTQRSRCKLDPPPGHHTRCSLGNHTPTTEKLLPSIQQRKALAHGSRHSPRPDGAPDGGVQGRGRIAVAQSGGHGSHGAECSQWP
jgi:hypothetical protein